jgi:APA family basic amino acid/polyamine antiporter
LQARPDLVARLGLFDTTMVVMGGIVGSGIFINPSIVAREVRTPVMILGAWALGGAMAILGALIWAELAARLPLVGGQYAYIREAFHPALAFLYGWALLLVTNAGGTAAVAVTFAKYFLALTRVHSSDAIVATAALAALTFINCLGVRAGSGVQSALMVLKIGVIAGLIVCGAWFVFASHTAPQVAWKPPLDRRGTLHVTTAMGAALVPVLFSYGGWQTANFIAGEVRDPRKNLPRSLLLGVTGVLVLYLTVNYIYLAALGTSGLAETRTPASEMMRRALGERGAALMGVGVTLSTLGFLCQAMLTYPRVYFAMARDGLFFRSVASVHPRTRVPVMAIALQGAIAIAVALSGTYEQIVSYVVTLDWVFFGLTASCLFVLRRRAAKGGAVESREAVAYRVPGHPVTTGVFVGISWLVVAITIYNFQGNALVGVCILLAGIPVYFLWRRRGHGTRGG